MVTILQVSRQAGVSTATVSRVINNPEVVGIRTRERVQEVIQRLGYRPNLVARDLASRSSRTIGVVINNFSSVYYGLMLEGVELALRKVGYKTIAESSQATSEGERQAWFSLLDRQCDGVVIHSDNLEDDELAVLLDRQPTSVLLNRYLKSHADRCVYLDNVQGGRLAAEYLISKGHRRIATITGPTKFYQTNDRLKGLHEGLAQAGITLDPDLVAEGDFHEAGGETATAHLLDTQKPFTALFCHNDEMAAGAMETCRRRGIRVPEEISILGFDDVNVASHLTPKLTTVRQPLREIGAAAGILAHSLATGEAANSGLQTVFEAEIVERATVMDAAP
tara:strand:- start:225244 stop:226251 length:1008 start_codon:yes stop_codon:yes gene_type:complete